MSKTRNMFDTLRAIDAEAKNGPSPDLVKCSDCGNTFKASECPTEADGGWETGYYEVPVCPNCEDGGCMDGWDFSPEQMKKYEEWKAKNG